jgi:CBS domain-containing protein
MLEMGKRPGLGFLNISDKSKLMGSELKVGDIMTKTVVVVPMGAGLLDAAKLMKKNEIGSIIIVEGTEAKRAKGIITERDIVHKVIAKNLDPYKVKVDDVMAKPLRVVKPETTIEEAAKAMRENRIKRLPVVNDDNELIGIISEGDIMKIFPIVVDLIEERATLG